MVEVTLALGILSFCLISITTFIPIGLGSQKDALNESKAGVALGMVTSAVRSANLVSRDSSGKATYKLPAYLSDNSDGKTFKVGDANASSYTFFLADDGSIQQTGDTDPARQTLFVKVMPPATEEQPVRVYAAVAWPWKPSDSAAMDVSSLTNRHGFVDAVITYAPRN